ncbi:hypothetical protein Btru_000577 [Bulinus truncatus]|nr:hypothetical protein Btru_000577 [Bulinus truncatus]
MWCVDTFPLTDCRTRDIDINFFIDCQHPIKEVEEKMKYILRNFVADSTKNSARNFRVTVLNLSDGKIMFSYTGERYGDEPIPRDHRNIYHVDARENLKRNHGLSVRLCGQCWNRWLPLRNQSNDIASCVLLRKHKKKRSWQQGDQYCKRYLKTHLVTLEDAWDFHSLQQDILNISDTTKIRISIGLNKVNVRNFGRLQWVNQRPVVSSVRNKIKLPRIHNALNKVCFFLKIHDANFTSIEFGSCSMTTATHSLCEAEISQHEIQIPSTPLNSKELKRDVHAIDKSSGNFMSISNSVHINSEDDLNDKIFPTFVCSQDGRHVSYHYVCDGFNDCFSGEDEKMCAFESRECNRPSKFVCSTPGDKGTYCVSIEARCNLIRDCPDGSDEVNCDECADTDCHNNFCIPHLWHFNCSYSISNYNTDVNRIRSVYENEDNYLEVNSSQGLFTLCDKTDWIPKCLYVRGQFGNVLGCEDMSHLFDCEDFRCPIGFAKCSMAYCVPIYLVNDDIKDCPHGEDEDRDELLKHNSNYFACYDSRIRIHVLQVCDGQEQCPRGDDELNCNVQCPLGFICLDGTVTVKDSSPVLDLSLIPPITTYLNISGVDVSLGQATNMDSTFIKLLVFIACHCNIPDDVKVRIKTNDVYLVDLSYNRLTRLNPKDLLSGFKKVYIVNLTHNSLLRFISIDYFSQFKYLQSLDLSFTKITQLNVYKNYELVHLKLQATSLINLNLSHTSRFELIDLRNSDFTSSIPQNFFFNISVSGEILADSLICCPLFRGPNIPEHKCLSKSIILSTCDDLIGDSLKRYLLWIVAACSVIGNLTVMGYRIFFNRATLMLTYGYLVTCLSFSDLLMGVYLVIIATIDYRYRDAYVGHQKSWRQSSLCQVTGALATLSSQTSTYLILLITLERYLTIKYPFGQHGFSKLTRNVCILLSWLLGFLLAFIPLLIPELSMYSTSGTCLGFPLRKSTGLAWIYSVVIYLLLNSLLFVLIACGQVTIFYMISKNSAKFKNSSQQSARRADDVKVAKKLALVVMSNFICWFPVCILGLRAAASDFEVDRHTYGWIVAVVLPVNAALNPILYTVPSIYRMWLDSKHGPGRLSANSAN